MERVVGSRFSRRLLPAALGSVGILLLCAGFAVALSVFAPARATPRTAAAQVWPIDSRLVAEAGFPESHLATPDGVAVTTGDLGARSFTADGATLGAALALARDSARAYVRALMRSQDDLIRRGQDGPTAKELAARRQLLGLPLRYAISYDRVAPGRERQSTEWGLATSVRALPFGLIGAVLGLIVGSSMASRRPEGSPSMVRLGIAAMVALPLTGVAVVVASIGSSYWVAAAGALLFATTLAASLIDLRASIVGVLVLVIVLTPLRGALLAVADVIELPRASLFVNAIQPMMIAGIACGAAVRPRRVLRHLPRSLLVAWLAVAAAAGLNFVTQSVGLSVYALGLGQYLTYPTLAILAWLVIPETGRPVLLLLVGMAALVSISIVFESADFVDFVEAVPPIDPVTGTGRWGGTTGSYIHASLFLGACIPILVARVLPLQARISALAIGALALASVGLALTYGRGGMVVAIFAVGVLIIAMRGRQRIRFAALCAGLVVGMAAVASATGDASRLLDRATSVVDWRNDPANVHRLDAMTAAWNRFREASLPQQVLGEGLAATGNTQKLAGRPPLATENLFLKLLVEVGVVGTCAISAVIGGAAIAFGRLARRAGGEPELQAAAAAGIGLTIYALGYPVLEPQLIALTWWLLLAVTIRALGGEQSAELRAGLTRVALTSAHANRPQPHPSPLHSG